jgi:hypothetical protein
LYFKCIEFFGTKMEYGMLFVFEEYGFANKEEMRRNGVE